MEYRGCRAAGHDGHPGWDRLSSRSRTHAYEETVQRYADLDGRVPKNFEFSTFMLGLPFMLGLSPSGPAHGKGVRLTGNLAVLCQPRQSGLGQALKSLASKIRNPHRSATIKAKPGRLRGGQVKVAFPTFPFAQAASASSQCFDCLTVTATIPSPVAQTGQYPPLTLEHHPGLVIFSYFGSRLRRAWESSDWARSAAWSV